MKLKTALLSAALLSAAALQAEIQIGNNESVAFLGDSITQFGKDKKPYVGYLHLVIEGLSRAGVTATAVPAGISGNKAPQMLARVDKDVIAKKPSWMLLSCGVNDVWHRKNGVPLEQYKKDIAAIADKAREAGIKVMIMTASMIREIPENDLNRKLAAYNDFLRAFAKERGLLLADINAEMRKEIASPELAPVRGNKLTYDGVHMNGRGHIMMACCILNTFGVPAETVEKFRKEKLETLPAAEIKGIMLTSGEQLALERLAAKEKISAEKYVKNLIRENLSASNAGGASK